MRVPEYGWTTQKVFHLMNFVVNGGADHLCFPVDKREDCVCVCVL